MKSYGTCRPNDFLNEKIRQQIEKLKAQPQSQSKILIIQLPKPERTIGTETFSLEDKHLSPVPLRQPFIIQL